MLYIRLKLSAYLNLLFTTKTRPRFFSVHTHASLLINSNNYSLPIGNQSASQKFERG